MRWVDDYGDPDGEDGDGDAGPAGGPDLGPDPEEMPSPPLRA